MGVGDIIDGGLGDSVDEGSGLSGFITSCVGGLALITGVGCAVGAVIVFTGESLLGLGVQAPSVQQIISKVFSVCFSTGSIGFPLPFFIF